MNMLFQPSGNPGQIPLCYIGINIPQLLLHAAEHLSAVGTAQCIGGEISDAAAGPVGVLKTSLPVIGNFHTQVLPVQLVPPIRYIRDSKRSGNELFFNLIADHDMEGIG